MPLLIISLILLTTILLISCKHMRPRARKWRYKSVTWLFCLRKCDFKPTRAIMAKSPKPTNY